MAKLPAKKPKLTQEEQLAELAALTGDVAAINLMQPRVAAAAVTPVSAPDELAAPVANPSETLALAGRAGEAPASGLTPELPPPSAGVEVLTPLQPLAATPTLAAADAEHTLVEEALEPTTTPAPATEAAYTLDALFKPSAEKKTVMMRITPALHQYLQQIGLLLGDGASVPDVVHNILLEWKTLHGPEVQKALQKQMRLMLKNAS